MAHSDADGTLAAAAASEHDELTTIEPVLLAFAQMALLYAGFILAIAVLPTFSAKFYAAFGAIFFSTRLALTLLAASLIPVLLNHATRGVAGCRTFRVVRASKLVLVVLFCIDFIVDMKAIHGGLPRYPIAFVLGHVFPGSLVMLWNAWDMVKGRGHLAAFLVGLFWLLATQTIQLLVVMSMLADK